MNYKVQQYSTVEKEVNTINQNNHLSCEYEVR